jgi:hypothetical protein
MPAPYEIIAQPFTVWIAPVGEAFPLIDAAPAGNWSKIGTSGDRNYSEDGVVITHGQSQEVFRASGSTGPIKAFRTEEEMTIGFSLVDVSLEQYARALNGNTVTDVPEGSEAGFRSIGLSRGLSVQQRALLVRGAGSPYGDDFNMQYEVPVCVQAGEPEVTYVKSAPAMLALSYMVLEDPSASSEDERFGRLIAQDADDT